MRRSLFILAAVVTAAAVVAVAPAQEPASGGFGDKGAFHADCGYSHRAPDDPIVFPRGPGASHSHDFFGARTTDAFSSNDSIRRARTTCVRSDTPFKDTDRSAYWAPTLYVNDVPVEAKLGIYYTAGRKPAEGIEPFPENLRVIAGDSKGGPAEIDGARVFIYVCPGGTLARGTATVAPTCATPELDLEIRFPDCWNGADLDVRDHKSHLAYARQVPGGNQCPSTHPISLPRLTMILKYPTAGGPTTRLASGDVSTTHADFMNGWDPDKLKGLVERCLNADRYCGGSDGPVPGH